MRVVVLCEGRTDYGFVLSFLLDQGFNHHEIRPNINPKGSGAGERYVREKYPTELHEMRRLRENKGLVVVVDADLKPVEERERALNEKLQEAGLAPPSGDERVAVLIPKRNLEAWVVCLRGDDSNESDDFKRKVATEDYSAAGRRFASRCRQSSESDAGLLESLKRGLQSARRFLERCAAASA